MEKNQLKRLKQLNRSELLEIMLALKRENDILMMENIRLKTLKHKLENEIAEIKGVLGRIERSTYETDFPYEIALDGAQLEYASTDEHDMLPVEGTSDGSAEKVADK